MINMTNTLKKKRVSKKLKQSWRKHVDVKDVDEFLDDKRLQERLGPAFSLRTDSELFQVDNKPTEVNLTSKQSKRLVLKNAPLKCFSMLQPHTKVPDPIAKRNRVRTPLERRHPIAKKIEQARVLSGIAKLRDRNAIENRVKSQIKKKKNKLTKGDYNSDIWTSEADKAKVVQKLSEWLNPECVRHNLKPLGHPVKSVPKSITMKQRSICQAVEPPHPGASYNPSLADHRELLHGIADKERGLIKQETHLLRVTSKMFSRVSQAEKDSNWLVEMSEGLPSKSNDVKPDETTDNSDDDKKDCYSTANPPAKNKKKDLKQKRKIREQRALVLQLRAARYEKKKMADIYKLKKLKESLEKKSEQEGKAEERRKDMKEKKSKQTKKLGKVKFEEPELEFNMKKDIAGNLRNVKKEGNLLVDRFKSLQKRNIIEPTVSQGLRKRTKVKRFTKKSHQGV